MRDAADSLKIIPRLSRFAALSTLLLCAICPRAFAASTTINWNPNAETYLAGYKLHYGLSPRGYQSHLDVGKTLSRTVSGLADGKTYYFAVTAYDSFGNESAYSAEVAVTTPGGAGETITAPLAPSGPASGVVGTTYTYTAGGAVSSSGDPVQYRFSWSDGTASDWLPAASAFAAKAWSAAGSYTLVRVQARCALHQSILSVPSPALTVIISSGAAETVTAPSAPAGPAEGSAGIAYAFTAGGAASSAGHPVQYRFHWGDGTASGWIAPGQAVTAWKSWGVPGTYLVRAEASCANHPAVGAFSAAIAVPIAPDGPVPSKVLWTRGDTGQAVLSEVDSSEISGTLPSSASAYVHSASGVGAPWRATSFAQVDASTGYVLWTRSDTGEAELWKVDPSVAGTVTILGSAALPGPSGGPWQATDYAHVDATTGFVLWTRSDTGESELWQVDPSLAGTIPVLGSAALSSPSGSGGPWQATDYSR
jgi:hypothetical protein